MVLYNSNLTRFIQRRYYSQPAQKTDKRGNRTLHRTEQIIPKQLPSFIGVITPRAPSRAATVGPPRGCGLNKGCGAATRSRQCRTNGAPKTPPEVSAPFCFFLGGDRNQTFQTGNGTYGKIVVSSVCKVDTISCGSHFQSSNPLRDIGCLFTVANTAGIQNLKVC